MGQSSNKWLRRTKRGHRFINYICVYSADMSQWPLWKEPIFKKYTCMQYVDKKRCLEMRSRLLKKSILTRQAWSWQLHEKSERNKISRPQRPTLTETFCHNNYQVTNNWLTAVCNTVIAVFVALHLNSVSDLCRRTAFLIACERLCSLWGYCTINTIIVIPFL